MLLKNEAPSPEGSPDPGHSRLVNGSRGVVVAFDYLGRIRWAIFMEGCFFGWIGFGGRYFWVGNRGEVEAAAAGLSSRLNS
jgi:hypothetical protein